MSGDSGGRPAETVSIHYLRPPDRLTVFRQTLVHREAGCTVTLMERTPLAAPVQVRGRTVLAPDAPVVWFTFDGFWHDIGRFHTDDVFTGWYANILTPVRFRSALEWEVTDLFLDVWLGADGALGLLDEDELAGAVDRGHVTADLARSARAEADRLLLAARRGDWPPAVAREWTLERARRGTRAADPV